MRDAAEPASMIEAAKEAADAGDYPAAERLLREAAAIQEATLGALHPDLASTLNNLAFICEQTNNLADAERGYRRAHAIAVASLGPRHPFVATSVKNLVGFCAAHGIPIWKPPVRSDAPPVAVEDGAAAERGAVIEAGTPIERSPLVESASVARGTSSDGASIERTSVEHSAGDSAFDEVTADRSRSHASGGRSASASQSTHRLTAARYMNAKTAVAALVVVALAATVLTTRRGSPSTEPTSASPPPPSTATPVVQPAVAAPPPSDSTPPRVERRESSDNVATSRPVTVLNAQLCTAIARRGSPDWQCTSPGPDLQPGTYFFYTRLLTEANTTVEHRWYRDERLHQVMRLRVAANAGSGYRTFSSNTVSAERAGDWKVELRSADGTLLHELRFAVRLP